MGGSQHPEHMGIVITVTKSVFGSCSRFADPAETIEGLGLGQRGRSLGREPLVEQGQQVFAPREQRVARNGNVHYPGTLRWWWQQDKLRRCYPGALRWSLHQAKLSRRFAKNLTESLAKIGRGKV